ncbi:MAG: alpha/beta hydrolase family protein [Chloroflexota bacterium]
MSWTRALTRRRALLASVVLISLLAFTHPVRVAILALAVLPSAVGSLPVDPLVQWTPRPDREEFRFDYPVGTVEGDIYSPGRGGRHGAIVLLLGARPVDRDEPPLVRFAEGLSRTGLVVMIPVASGLAAGRIQAEEVDALVKEVELLRGRPDVDPARIGVIGFSVGGSVAIQAAADPRLDGKLVFVNAFGSYFDPTDFVRAISTRSLAYAGVDEVWVPDPLVLFVVARQMVDTMPDPTDRDVLDRLYLQADSSARDDVPQMTPAGRAALGLLDGLPPAETEAALEQMPPETLARLRAIAPSDVIEHVHTRLFLMHDLSDTVVPYTESRRMAAHTPPAILDRYVEFDLFDHVTPNRPPGDLSFYVEVLKLARQIYGVLLYVL